MYVKGRDEPKTGQDRLNPLRCKKADNSMYNDDDPFSQRLDRGSQMNEERACRQGLIGVG